MKRTMKWIFMLAMALLTTMALGPNPVQDVLARGRGGGGGGGRGGGGRGGGGRGGGRGGRGGGRGGRGGSRGGRGGGRSGSGPGNIKEPMDYLLYLQKEDADDMRPDFIFNNRDEALIKDRDRSRDEALRAEREKNARKRRETEQGSSL